MKLMQRRRALMGAPGESNPSYVSSTGKTYYKKHVAVLSNKTIANWLSTMGEMSECTELTLTGNIAYYGATNKKLNAAGTPEWSNYVPNIEKIVIIPQKISGVSSTFFSFNHYPFSNLTKCTSIQLGGLKADGYCYFNGGCYFRSDSGRTIGTNAGLELIAYRTSYDAKAGFANGNKASNTTIIQYNWETGEVLTA